jgi:hypothetical protein
MIPRVLPASSPLSSTDARRLEQIREVIRDALAVGHENVLAIALHTLAIEFPNAGLSDPADQTLSADPRPEWEGVRTARNSKSKAGGDLETAARSFTYYEGRSPDNIARRQQ